MRKHYPGSPSRKKIFFLAVVFFVFLLFAINLGFRLTIKASLLVFNFFSSQSKFSVTNREKDTINSNASLMVDEIPQATNSSRVIVQFTPINLDEVSIYLNNQEVKKLKTQITSTVTEEIGELKEGKNEIYLVGKNNSENIEKKTNPVTIIYKATKPKLEIIEPKNEQTINSDQLMIRGETEKEVFVKIDGVPVILDAIGRFQHSVRLNEGENILTIEATDVAGNSEKKTLKVIYQKED
ncbi:MAG: hypothetical protein NZL96_03385 [Patescibacteria group bacterium]|nr:hypothetical protein [Patescibacteria group bacterium]